MCQKCPRNELREPGPGVAPSPFAAARAEANRRSRDPLLTGSDHHAEFLPPAVAAKNRRPSKLI